MWRINHRVNQLGRSLWRIIYSPNWSISPCGCRDTCGPALCCGEHVQAPAETQTQTCGSWMTRCMDAKSETRSRCVSRRTWIFDESKYAVRMWTRFFFRARFSEVFFFYVIIRLTERNKAARMCPESRHTCSSSSLSVLWWRSLSASHYSSASPLLAAPASLWMADTGSRQGRLASA